jgi:hypothetical protein
VPNARSLSFGRSFLLVVFWIRIGSDIALPLICPGSSSAHATLHSPRAIKRAQMLGGD